MIKELTPQEVARKLADEGCFDGLCRDKETEAWKGTTLNGVLIKDVSYPFWANGCVYRHCAIEVPDKYVPYPNNECPPLKCGDVIVKKDNGTEYLVNAIDKRKGPRNHVLLITEWKSNETLFKNYAHLDGSPIGKLEE